MGEFHGQLPSRAWLLDDTVVLRFDADPGREVFAVSSWQDAVQSTGEYSHALSRLEYVDNDWPEGLQREKAFLQIPILPESRWRSLLGSLTDNLVPQAVNQGLLLLVQQRQLVVYRNEQGQMLSVPASELPEAVEIVNSCDQEAFMQGAAATLERYAEELNLPDRQFLFQTQSGDMSGLRFVLVDLEARQITTMHSSLPAEVVDELGLIGFSAQSITSILLRSHVITFLKNPLTSIGRLVNFALTTTYNFIYFQDRSIRQDLPPVGQSEPMDLARWEADLDQLVSSKPYQGTMEFLIDGDAFFNSLLDDIGRALESIDIRIYIFDRDDYAISIADLLKDRSHSVPVRVLMDDLGSLVAGNLPPATPNAPGFRAPGSIVDYLRDGSEIKVRRASNPWFTADHTKTLIFDDWIAYTGGMNIGREYRSEWHDLMVRVQGPIAKRISRDFAKAWGHAGPGGDLAYAWRSAFTDRPEHGEPDGRTISIRPLYTKTAKREILRAQVLAIRRARNHVYIQNGYLSDDAILNALIDARRRGVDVRVVLPAGNDSGIMAASNIITANVLIANGIRVYAYPGMTHVKAGIFDGWASLGSANYDKLSFFVNQEMNLAFSDPETVAKLRVELFERDFAFSEELKEPILAGWSDFLYEFVADQL
jgi:cardiolipin synthase